MVDSQFKKNGHMPSATYHSFYCAGTSLIILSDFIQLTK